jgi:formate/nitrite transporter FocA (FNT family)
MPSAGKAGKDSPNLEPDEQAQAAQHSALPARVIHEVVRDEGEQELERQTSAVAWSGLAAGMSMGFSFLGLAMVTSMLPATPWRHLIAGAGYTVGFVLTVLGRQELFTESTLTAMLPLLVRRDRATLLAVLRFWATVLTANLVGTALFAVLMAQRELFDASVNSAMMEIARAAFAGSFAVTMLKAVLSGWLIALMAWILPSAKSARLFVILLLTYVVAVCGLPHVVAGSGEAAYAVLMGQATLRDYAVGFFLPTLIGNTIGGVAFVALLNHAPVAQELKDRGEAAGSKPAGTRPAFDRSAGRQPVRKRSLR